MDWISSVDQTSAGILITLAALILGALFGRRGLIDLVQWLWRRFRRPPGPADIVKEEGGQPQTLKQQLQMLIDEGRSLRRQCAEVPEPPPEALAENWRIRTREFLSESFGKIYASDWDIWPGKSRLDPSELPRGFTGLTTPQHKALWDGINIRVARLEQLLRQI